MVGESDSGSDFDFAVARCTSAGDLDTSFSTDGKLLTDFSSDADYGYAVVVDSDDRIVVAGEGWNGSIPGLQAQDFAVARYTSAGVLDTSFSTDGKLTTDIGSGNDYGRAVAVDSQDRVVVAGYSHNGSNNDFAVARYTSAGELDTTFSTDGKLTTAIGSGTDYGQAVAVDSNDRIVVAGYAWNDSNRDFAVVRHTSAGVLDAAFSSAFGAVDGMVMTPICTYSDFGYAVALD